MSQTSPWKFGDLNDIIIKLRDQGADADPIVKIIEVIREILGRLDAIDAETERRQAALAASQKLRNLS
jgi:hypothetical protein